MFDVCFVNIAMKYLKEVIYLSICSHLPLAPRAEGAGAAAMSRQFSGVVSSLQYVTKAAVAAKCGSSRRT